MKKLGIQIAIDGPVAAGCSTIAKLVAERLGFLYVDTGAMYRLTGLLAHRHQVDPTDETAVTKLVFRAKIDMRQPRGKEVDGRLITVLLDGEDVSWEIRTDKMSKYSAIVAQHPKVRKLLVKKQQQIAAQNDVVMEGRDITYIVLPDADVKIYLTAAPKIRAKRRLMQEQNKGRDIDFQTAYEELIARDKHDMEREVDPLKIVDDAIIIDTSELNIDQVVEAIIAQVELKKAN